MGYLDKAGLRHFTDWVRSRLSGKQDALTPGSGIVLKDGNIGVALPAKTVTEAEYNALTEAEKQAEVLYAITDDKPSGGGSVEEVYSTEETRIGTWIDGKPLYRVVIKTITPGSSGSDTSTEVAKYSTNVEEVVRCNAIITSKSGQKTIAPYYYSSADRAWVSYNPPAHTNVDYRDTVRMMVGSGVTSRPALIILEYTKTTDEGENV